MYKYSFIIIEDTDPREVIVEAADYNLALSAVSDKYPEATVVGHRMISGGSEPESAEGDTEA